MRGRNDWGVPDWLEAAQYPPHDAGAAWAWEFLRRSPQYREWWMQDVLPFVGADGSIDCDASIGKYRQREDDGTETSWGVVKEAERFGLLVGPRDPAWPADIFVMAVDDACIREIRSGGERSVKLSRSEAAYIFDLSRPLEPQFARALKAAKGLQAHRRDNGEVRIEAARQRADKYILYLRLLDAEDAGAARERIEDALFGDIPRTYPENGRSAAFRAARRAAHRLRDGGYRALAGT